MKNKTKNKYIKMITKKKKNLKNKNIKDIYNLHSPLEIIKSLCVECETELGGFYYILVTIGYIFIDCNWVTTDSR